MTIDHPVPQFMGGTYYRAVVPACKKCNNKIKSPIESTIAIMYYGMCSRANGRSDVMLDQFEHHLNKSGFKYFIDAWIAMWEKFEVSLPANDIKRWMQEEEIVEFDKTLLEAGVPTFEDWRQTITGYVEQREPLVEHLCFESLNHTTIEQQRN